MDLYFNFHSTYERVGVVQLSNLKKFWPSGYLWVEGFITHTNWKGTDAFLVFFECIVMLCRDHDYQIVLHFPLIVYIMDFKHHAPILLLNRR